MKSKFNIEIFFFYFITSILILICAYNNFFPSIFVASIFSSDHCLSNEFVELLKRSQWILACVILFVSPCAFAFSFLKRCLQFLVNSSNLNFNMMIAMATFLATYCVQYFVFDNIPHISDAVSHLFQAKIFNAGMLYAPAPLCPRAFHQINVAISFSGKWFSKYTIGHALLLAIAMKLHAVTLLLPICAAVINLLSVYFCRLFYTKRTARIVGILCIFSPLFLLVNASYMSHTTFLMLFMFAIAWLIYVLREDTKGASIVAAFLSGFFFGWAFLTRPQDTFFMGIFILVTLLLIGRFSLLTLVRYVVYIFAGLLPFASIYLLWNQVIYNDSFVVGYGFSKSDIIIPSLQGAYGFSNQFTISKAIQILVWTSTRFTSSLLGCCVFFIFVIPAFMMKRFRRQNGICLLGCGIIIGFYFFYSYYGGELEARYYYPIIPFILAIISSGIDNTFQMATKMNSSNKVCIQSLVTTYLLICIIFSIVYYWPSVIWPKYAHNYERTTTQIQKWVMNQHIENGIILLDDSEVSYASGFIYNDPLLTNSVIYAADSRTNVECLTKAFPSKTLYRLSCHLPDIEITEIKR